MTPQQHCKQICKKSGSNFVTTFFLLGKKKRLAMEAFYAFCREVDDAVDEAPSPEKAASNIQYWKEEVEQLYQGKPRNMVMQALLPATKNYNIPKEYLKEIILGCEMDLTHKTYATYSELEQYCYRVASCVGLVCLHIFEIELTDKTKGAGIALGKALQITNILRDIVSDLGRQRVYLPQEDLNQFGISIESLSARNKENLNLLELLYFEMKRAQDYFKEAWENFPQSKKEKRKMLAARLMGTLYEALLDKISRNPMQVFQKKVRLTGMEKLEIAGKEIWSCWV